MTLIDIVKKLSKKAASYVIPVGTGMLAAVGLEYLITDPLIQLSSTNPDYLAAFMNTAFAAATGGIAGLTYKAIKDKKEELNEKDEKHYKKSNIYLGLLGGAVLGAGGGIASTILLDYYGLINIYGTGSSFCEDLPVVFFSVLGAYLGHKVGTKFGDKKSKETKPLAEPIVPEECEDVTPYKHPDIET